MKKEKKQCKHEGCITLLHKGHEGDYCHVHEKLYYVELEDENGKPKKQTPKSPYQIVIEMGKRACADMNDCDICELEEYCYLMWCVLDNYPEAKWEKLIKYEQAKT